MKLFYGLLYVHAATRFVERLIWRLRRLLSAKLADELNSECKVNCGLWVITFNSLTSKKCTSLGSRELNYEAASLITNALNTAPRLVSDWKITSISESSLKFPVFVMVDNNRNFTNHIVMAKTKNEPRIETKPKTLLKSKEQVNEKFPYDFDRKKTTSDRTSVVNAN